MSTQTTNLGLVKPDLTDNADISVLNQNADKIDAAVPFKFGIEGGKYGYYSGLTFVPFGGNSNALTPVAYTLLYTPSSGSPNTLYAFSYGGHLVLWGAVYSPSASSNDWVPILSIDDRLVMYSDFGKAYTGLYNETELARTVYYNKDTKTLYARALQGSKKIRFEFNLDAFRYFGEDVEATLDMSHSSATYFVGKKLGDFALIDCSVTLKNTSNAWVDFLTMSVNFQSNIYINASLSDSYSQGQKVRDSGLHTNGVLSAWCASTDVGKNLHFCYVGRLTE